jgi:hypothetical protein
MPITVLDWAIFRGAKEDAEGHFGGAEFERVKLPMMGGCFRCGATVAAYNACPTMGGLLACKDGCVGIDGYETCEDADRDNFPEQYGVRTFDLEEGDVTRLVVRPPAVPGRSEDSLRTVAVVQVYDNDAEVLIAARVNRAEAIRVARALLELAGFKTTLDALGRPMMVVRLGPND